MAENIENRVQMILRIPVDVRDWLKEDARQNERTMNSQVVAVLRERMGMKALEKQQGADKEGI